MSPDGADALIVSGAVEPGGVDLQGGTIDEAGEMQAKAALRDVQLRTLFRQVAVLSATVGLVVLSTVFTCAVITVLRGNDITLPGVALVGTLGAALVVVLVTFVRSTFATPAEAKLSPDEVSLPPSAEFGKILVDVLKELGRRIG